MTISEMKALKIGDRVKVTAYKSPRFGLTGTVDELGRKFGLWIDFGGGERPFFRWEDHQSINRLEVANAD